MVFAFSLRSSTERHGDFSESQCFTFLLGVLLVSGFLFVVVLGFAVLFLVYFGDT